MNKYALIILIIVPLVIFVLTITYKDKIMQGGNPYENSEDSKVVLTDKNNVKPPTTKLDIIKTYKVKFETTEGNIVIKVDALDTTMASTNFVYLSRIGFYDGTIFHRVVKDFMIQGGDPLGNGTGGPGYTFNDEPFDGEYVRGTVAMANSGPNSNGSQFFIIHKDYTQLPKDYVIFGKVVEGMDVVDKIAESPVENNGAGEMSKPISPVTINKAEVIEEN